MKKIILLLCCIVSVTGYASNDQILLVDEAHIQIANSFEEMGKPYYIKAAKSIRIDASKYVFVDRAGGPSNIPKTISVFVGDKNSFRLDWEPGKTVYDLNVSTLYPVWDRSGKLREFGGFQSGESMVISIGTRYTFHKGGPSEWHAFWVGRVYIEDELPGLKGSRK